LRRVRADDFQESTEGARRDFDQGEDESEEKDMNHAKVMQAARECEAILRTAYQGEAAFHPVRVPGYQQYTNGCIQAQHALWMCVELQTFPPEKVEKAMRWLGFVQGILWCHCRASIEVFKKMNMPDEEKTP
jgi:hypothetical protein